MSHGVCSVLALLVGLGTRAMEGEPGNVEQHQCNV